MFGNPETTTGGRALKFYASMRIDIRRIGAIKDGDEAVGSRTKLKVVKNKLAPPFRVAEFDVLFGEGFSREGDLIDLGLAHRIVEKSGAWFSYGDLRLGQGRENARIFLRDNPDLAREIDQKLRSQLKLTRAEREAAEAAAPAAQASTGDGKPTAPSSDPSRLRPRAPRASAP
jgi:recombination protein RecA